MDAGFELSKWYLDAVSDEGDVFIAYSAELRWRSLALRYTGTLVQRAGEETRERSTLRGAEAPGLSGNELSWASPPLGVSGRWTALSTPVAETILARDEGRVEWRCHMPRARAEVAFEGAPTLRGLGYAEHLSVTLPPWQLPIDALYWGRFLSEDASLVWIDWRGPYEKQVVLLDGAPVGPARIDERGLRAGPVRLTLSEQRVLRQGALGKTVLGVLPSVEKLFPVRILATDECKWLARGMLEHGGGVSEGWVVHEVVRWP
jgi:hypothetical protein